jgi:hypothetical protein
MSYLKIEELKLNVDYKEDRDKKINNNSNLNHCISILAS